MATGQCQASAFSHSAAQTTISLPTILEGMQQSACWGGERVHACPCWTARSMATSGFASFPYLTALTALVSFCNQINSHFQLLLRADTAETKEWFSSGCLVPHCSFSHTHSLSLVNVKLLCPSQDWSLDLWIQQLQKYSSHASQTTSDLQWFAWSKSAVYLKLQYLIPPLTAFISKGQEGAYLYVCLGFVTLCYIFNEGQDVLFYKAVPTEQYELARYLKL